MTSTGVPHQLGIVKLQHHFVFIMSDKILRLITLHKTFICKHKTLFSQSYLLVLVRLMVGIRKSTMTVLTSSLCVEILTGIAVVIINI